MTYILNRWNLLLRRSFNVSPFIFRFACAGLYTYITVIGVIMQNYFLMFLFMPIRSRSILNFVVIVMGIFAH